MICLSLNHLFAKDIWSTVSSEALWHICVDYNMQLQRKWQYQESFTGETEQLYTRFKRLYLQNEVRIPVLPTSLINSEVLKVIGMVA